jgi:hypothetical protein
VLTFFENTSHSATFKVGKIRGVMEIGKFWMVPLSVDQGS